MTEVALDTATPHAPSVIRLLLDKVGITYREVVEHAQLPAASRVQAVLLDDEIGALMVLFPQSQLLDLNRLGELTGRESPAERVAASVAAHLIAVQRGARIVRVHDVAATVDALKVWQAVDAVPAVRVDAKPSLRWPDED